MSKLTPMACLVLLGTAEHAANILPSEGCQQKGALVQSVATR
jgi:hypothetical protein